MSQHASLRFDSVSAKHRSVFKRIERVKIMKEQGKWQDRTSVFGLPKVKSQKIKIKKIQGAEEKAEAAQGAAALASPAKETPAAKDSKAKK